MVRIWVNGEDFGTVSEVAAEKIVEAGKNLFPGNVYFVEPVASDAPTFLRRNEPGAAMWDAPGYSNGHPDYEDE